MARSSATFKPGERRGGRKKGQTLASTTAVKEALSLAFEGIGGTPKLIAWANEQPTEFFKLWAKMLPQELIAKVAVIPAEVSEIPISEAEWESQIAGHA